MIESIREAFDRIGWFELAMICLFVYCMVDSWYTNQRLRKWIKTANKQLASLAGRVHRLEVPRE